MKRERESLFGLIIVGVLYTCSLSVHCKNKCKFTPNLVAAELPLILVYCKFGNFRENFIFANSVKRHICDVKNS